MDTIYVVIPAYNEEANIEYVVKQWYSVLKNKSENSRIVIADSGSDDQTHSILLKMQQEYPKIVLLSHTGKQHGPKVMALYKYSILQNADYVFQTDSDGQTNPEEFEDFWEQREKYTGIFGRRVSRGDGVARCFVEKVVCLLLKSYFKVNIPDANAPFRLMKINTVKKYINRMPEDYTLPNIMITTFFVYYNENVLFKNISFKPRQGGTNSINFWKIIKIGWKSLKDFGMFRKKMKVKNRRSA